MYKFAHDIVPTLFSFIIKCSLYKGKVLPKMTYSNAIIYTHDIQKIYDNET